MKIRSRLVARDDMDDLALARAARTSGNPCWGIWKRKVPVSNAQERPDDTFDTVVGDYDPDTDLVTFRNRRTWRRVGLRRDFFLERFQRVAVAADQGNSGAWG